MYPKIILACTVLGVLFFYAPLILAHGNSFSYEENKDGYLIDIGLDESMTADQSVRFDFAVYPENNEAVEGDVFTDVWVTITQDRKVFFAGGIDKPVFGTTGFTYVFPKEGTYTLSARFQKNGETVVATEFPVTVIPPLERDTTFPPFVLSILFAAGGLLAGFSGGFFMPRKDILPGQYE